MIILPAVDLKEGKCVRLLKGDMDTAKEYADKPEEMAKRWEKAGGHYLHVVDLDGAFSGRTENREAIANIVKAVDIPVEVGGGMRNLESVRTMINLGVSRVILGTAAVKNQDVVDQAVDMFGAEKVVAGIDAKDGTVKVDGWAGESSVDFVDLGKDMAARNVVRAIYTDIDKDGAMAGPNIENTAKLAAETGLKVIASGGVTTIEDVKKIIERAGDGIEGMIIGKALYEETIDLEEAVSLCSQSG